MERPPPPRPDSGKSEETFGLSAETRSLDISWLKEKGDADDERTLAEIFAEIKSHSAALAANVAKLENLLKGVAE